MAIESVIFTELESLAKLIDQIGIPLILAWFMIRMEKILIEVIKSNKDLNGTVMKLIELIEER